MKFSAKTALAAAGAFLLFALLFSWWILGSYQRDTLRQIKSYEETLLLEQKRQFETQAGTLPGTALEAVERQLFREIFGSASAFYREGRPVYNMTGYEFDWEAYKESRAGLEGLEDGSGRVFTQEEGGRRLQVFVTHGQLGGSAYSVVHYREVTEVYDQVRAMFGRGFLGALALSLLFLLLLQLVLHRLWRPFRKLQEAANQIAGGSYGVRAGLKRRDEIGQVAESFDGMAEKVEEHVRELSQVNERQRQLLGSLAHELKTPMTAILGYAQTLRRVRLSPEKQEKALYYIESECRRLSGLSAKMLELTGLYQEEGRLERREIPVEELFDRAEGIARCRLEQKGLILRREISPGGETVQGDEDLLISFLLNLMDNGCKASAPGGELTLISDGRGMGLRDYGCGIPPEEISRVTEAFYMVDKSRSRKEGGAGLGLALCQGIARIHGARLLIESRLGEGTLVLMCWEED